MDVLAQPGKVMPSRRFIVDARTIISLGRDSIKDASTAVIELVKNSYDAGAHVAEVELQSSSNGQASGSIRIADDGHGMSSADLDSKWLRIGYSDKLAEPHVRSRRRLGEKGVGRLSADRLGQVLRLKTKAEGYPGVGIEIDWSDFEQVGTELSKVKIKELSDVAFSIPTPQQPQVSKQARRPRSTGTELFIENLRQSWGPEDVQKLKQELSTLIAPRPVGAPFEIVLRSSIDPQLDGVVQSMFEDTAPFEGRFTLDARGMVRGHFTVRTEKSGPAQEDLPVMTWSEFVQMTDWKPDLFGQLPYEFLGPVEVTLLFFPRRSDLTTNLRATPDRTRDFLDRFAGVRLYRDGAQIRPYGDMRRSEGGDWLGLGDRKARNPAGAARKSFRTSPYQLVGSVMIGRDQNPNLRDTSAREGLIHGPAFGLLTSFVTQALMRLETRYHLWFKDRGANDAHPAALRARSKLGEIKQGMSSATHQLKELKSELDGDDAKRIQEVIELVGQASAASQELEATVKELISQTTIYRGLASIGIAAATFSHETDSALDQFLTAVGAARIELQNGKPPSLPDAINELDKAFRFGERVSAWGKFAVKRVAGGKRQRRSVNVQLLLEDLIADLRQAFQNSTIELEVKLEEITTYIQPMDLESLLSNLLTNAYFFTKQAEDRRVVSVTLSPKKQDGKDGFLLAVADSGPGVPESDHKNIWQPLFSTKVNAKGKQIGTGLGLSIVESIVQDCGGTKQVSRDKRLGGARFEIWLPIEAK